MNIVVLDGYVLNPGDLSWDGLKEFGQVTVYDRTPHELITKRLAEADVVFINKTPIRAEHLDAAKRLKLISVFATGYDPVDVDAARARGIPVCNVPAYSTDSVAQMTFSLLLELCLHVGLHDQAVREGRWVASIDYSFRDTPLIELAGKTMGIIGCGAIGQSVARIAQAFGMRVLGYSPRPKPAFPGEMTELDTLLAMSDVVSLHCPANASTVGMIDAAVIAKMKPGAILLNTARGKLIVEKDVVEALESGRLGGFGADVVSVEPMAADSPLLGVKNSVITPHIAWAPLAARKRLMAVSVENLRAFAAGAPINCVNMG